MKYLLLIYSNPENWEHPIYRETGAFRALPADERDALDRQAEALGDELRECATACRRSPTGLTSMRRSTSPAAS
jgi:hypothetical protein